LRVVFAVRGTSFLQPSLSAHILVAKDQLQYFSGFSYEISPFHVNKLKIFLGLGIAKTSRCINSTPSIFPAVISGIVVILQHASAKKLQENTRNYGSPGRLNDWQEITKG
jgi:hypothetical protein